MVLGKFQRFGDANIRTPLNLAWPIGGESFCASVIILGVEVFNSSVHGACLKLSGDIICSLRKVDADCILPISPPIEHIAAGDDSQVPSVIDVMKIKDLSTAFDVLIKRVKVHSTKNSDIQPIEVGDKLCFVAGSNDPYALNLELLVCNLCVPPQYIRRPNGKDPMPTFADENELQRALHNHMAAHQLKHPELLRTNEPCGFCCGSCHAVVQLAPKNKQDIVKKKLVFYHK